MKKTAVIVAVICALTAIAVFAVLKRPAPAAPQATVSGPPLVTDMGAFMDQVRQLKAAVAGGAPDAPALERIEAVIRGLDSTSRCCDSRMPAVCLELIRLLAGTGHYAALRKVLDFTRVRNMDVYTAVEGEIIRIKACNNSRLTMQEWMLHEAVISGASPDTAKLASARRLMDGLAEAGEYGFITALFDRADCAIKDQTVRAEWNSLRVARLMAAGYPEQALAQADVLRGRGGELGVRALFDLGASLCRAGLVAEGLREFALLKERHPDSGFVAESMKIARVYQNRMIQ